MSTVKSQPDKFEGRHNRRQDRAVQCLSWQRRTHARRRHWDRSAKAVSEPATRASDEQDQSRERDALLGSTAAAGG